MGAMVRKQICSPCQIHIYFAWVKLHSKRGIFILARAILKIMCILNVRAGEDLLFLSSTEVFVYQKKL